MKYHFLFSFFVFYLRMMSILRSVCLSRLAVRFCFLLGGNETQQERTAATAAVVARYGLESAVAG